MGRADYSWPLSVAAQAEDFVQAREAVVRDALAYARAWYAWIPIEEFDEARTNLLMSCKALADLMGEPL